ncbi:piggyBac transposable element-derived protein 3 [Biomphalaria glabrata]
MVGGIHCLPDSSTPLDYFRLFIDDDIINMIVEQTNLYAEQQQRNKGPDKYWKPVDQDDIVRFIYINMYFGIVKLPNTRMYWLGNKMWRIEGVAAVMGRCRFEKIRQYIHLMDKEKMPPRGSSEYDPIYKVRNFYNIKEKCKALYKPGKKLSVDEAMIGFRGRLFFLQYIKNKPTAWGIKVWCLAEAETGYILDYNVYTGKDKAPMPDGLGHKVVMQLAEPYLDKGHEIFCDNFFSSIKLGEDLLDRKTYICSTIRPNRKGWPYEKVKKAPKGQCLMKQKGMLVATQWTDKRQVNLLSSNADPVMATVQRRTKDGLQDIIIPSPVLAYNSGMFGVDLADQYRSYYPIGRNGKKWWRYLMWFCFQVATINSYILMKRSTNFNNFTLFNHLNFRMQLLEEMIPQKRNKRALTESPSVGGKCKPSFSDHQSRRLPGRQRRCFQCAKEGKKTGGGRSSETCFGCHMCDIHLHKGYCFAKFHESIKN